MVVRSCQSQLNPLDGGISPCHSIVDEEVEGGGEDWEEEGEKEGKFDEEEEMECDG